MRLVLTVPPLGRNDQPRHVTLRDEGIEVGGASDCDAIVEHASVGTARVRIERRGAHWVVVDRDGRGACAVGGVPLRARVPRLVGPPYGLRLGEVELPLGRAPGEEGEEAVAGPGDATREAADGAPEAAPGLPRVRVVEGPRLGDTLELTHAGPYRIGRGESCDLFLDADEASREHVSIERDGDRVVVRDLGSQRGTYLGAVRLVPNRSAVWDPARMLRAAEGVFALEVAPQEAPPRHVGPLDEVEYLAPQPGEAPASGAAEAALDGPASEAAGGKRKPSFVLLLVIALVIGCLGAVALRMLTRS
jgi:hypothetical protein